MKKERFTCKRDDLTIRGEYYRPDGTDLPIVIISHSVPHKLLLGQSSREGRVQACLNYPKSKRSAAFCSPN